MNRKRKMNKVASVIQHAPETTNGNQVKKPIEREKVCPLLLRVFYKLGGHHRPEEFIRGKEPTYDEVQIYTWKDATLRELTELVKEIHSGARQRESRLSFAFIYPSKMNGRMVLKEVGQVFSNRARGDHRDDKKTLDELHFETGDFLDVAIYVNG